MRYKKATHKVWLLVQAKGLEPSRRGHQILNLARLPFRHTRIPLYFTMSRRMCQDKIALSQKHLVCTEADKVFLYYLFISTFIPLSVNARIHLSRHGAQSFFVCSGST